MKWQEFKKLMWRKAEIVPTEPEERDLWVTIKDYPEYNIILVLSIKRVHPKIVVITTGTLRYPVELTLALTTEGYSRLTKLVTKKNLHEMYPLYFAVDKKGYVLGWVSQREMQKRTQKRLSP